MYTGNLEEAQHEEIATDISHIVSTRISSHCLCARPGHVGWRYTQKHLKVVGGRNIESEKEGSQIHCLATFFL